MKKFPTLIVTALTCFALTACNSNQPNNDAESKISEITEHNSSDSTNNNPDISTTKSEMSEIPEENSPHKITLSGDPNDTFDAETDCYTENDEVILYFQKDVTIKGDMLEIATKAMHDLCETTGFNFHRNYCSDENYRYLMDMYFEPNIFDNVNSDGLKINVLVVDLGDQSEWADGNNAVLDQNDFDYADDRYGTLYHELAHVIHIRNGVYLGQMMNEGFATYIENKTRLDHNIPAWTAAQYYFPTEFDESLISGCEEAFRCKFDDIDTNYQYGFRFVTFLYETYGEDIFADILSKATENGFDQSYNEDDIEASLNEDTQQLLEIIKALTTENVMSDFNQWYNNNWDTLGQEYFEQVNSLE